MIETLWLLQPTTTTTTAAAAAAAVMFSKQTFVTAAAKFPLYFICTVKNKSDYTQNTVVPGKGNGTQSKETCSNLTFTVRFTGQMPSQTQTNQAKQ